MFYIRTVLYVYILNLYLSIIILYVEYIFQF
jgi:hypothetical protein